MFSSVAPTWAKADQAWGMAGSKTEYGGRRYLTALLLAGLLVVCHGCHGDEDNELFACARADLADGIAAQGRGTSMGTGVAKN